MKYYKLPQDHKPYTDKYFLRANEILKKENINPFVTAQIFLRSSGKIYGINESIAILNKYSNIFKNGGKVYTLKEKSSYNPEETVMLIKGKVQDIIELETIILGVISAETTKKNDKIDLDLEAITKRIEDINKLTDKRPILYFGARHWRFDEDAKISEAAFKGGISECSTDIGAKTRNKIGVGTIPHSLENILAWQYGHANAVLESTLMFDKYIDANIPRIALVDYCNREIDDTIRLIKKMQKKLYGIRIDTCGENVMQGAVYGGYNKQNDWWGQKGVSISGVLGLIDILQAQILYKPKIILSSGFANPEKVKAFIDAEKKTRIKLFDSLGVGAIFPGRFATMDIVQVGHSLDNMQNISKVGRSYNVNFHRLKLVA